MIYTHYIQTTPNPSGVYPPAQSNPAPGLLPLTEEQAETVAEYSGFVIINQADDGTVTVRPNLEAWEAWKAAEAAKPKPEPVPTPEERIAALEEENKLLTAQVSAQTEQMDFYEDCIAEMAEVVYA